MGIAYHTTYSPDGAGMNLFDRVVLGTVTAVYPSGVSAGAASTLAVTWTEPVPTAYTALMSPIENSSYFITSKTTTGFTLNVVPTPTVAGTVVSVGTLAGGSVEILLIS